VLPIDTELMNYYGVVQIRQLEDKFQWGLGHQYGEYWEDISESLYREIEKHVNKS